MNQNNSIPFATPPYWGLKAVKMDDLEQAALQVSWLIRAMKLLAELIWAVGAFFLYLAPISSESLPFYLNYLHLIVYLGQGLYWVQQERAKSAKPGYREQQWWRLAIAVLGWPVHRGLREFHEQVNQFDDLNPLNMLTLEWLQGAFVRALIHWGMVWFFTTTLTFVIVIIIEQGGFLS